MAQGSAMSRTMNAINATSGIRNAGSRRGNARRNRQMSIIRELREGGTSGLPDTIYNYQGKMNARQRRDYVSNLIGRKLSNRVHVSFARDTALDRTSNANGIRRTLSGFRISYSYS